MPAVKLLGGGWEGCWDTVKKSQAYRQCCTDKSDDRSDWKRVRNFIMKKTSAPQQFIFRE